MDEQETQTTNLFPIFMTICFSLTVGFGIGYTCKSSKDKSATVIFDEIVSTYREMQDVAGFPSYKGGEFTKRLSIQDTEEGIGYIEIHYIPRASFPKLHDEDTNEKTK